jgi:hypothetical protein
MTARQHLRAAALTSRLQAGLLGERDAEAARAVDRVVGASCSPGRPRRGTKHVQRVIDGRSRAYPLAEVWP